MLFPEPESDKEVPAPSVLFEAMHQSLGAFLKAVQEGRAVAAYVQVLIACAQEEDFKRLDYIDIFIMLARVGRGYSPHPQVIQLCIVMLSSFGTNLFSLISCPIRLHNIADIFRTGDTGFVEFGLSLLLKLAETRAGKRLIAQSLDQEFISKLYDSVLLPEKKEQITALIEGCRSALRPPIHISVEDSDVALAFAAPALGASGLGSNVFGF